MNLFPGNHFNYFSPLRRSAGLLLMWMLVILVSCNDDESLKKKKNITTTNNQPASTNPTVTSPISECSSHVLYGYCDKVSYNKDEKVLVYIQSNQSISSCRLDI